MNFRATFGCSLGAALLSACGGSSSGGGGPTGVFLDSAVEGLDYIATGGATGRTNVDGRFAYGNGQSVTFYVGDLIIGVAPGQAIVTPVDLVNTAMDETDEAVTNIARFLLTLDLDQNPDNGIEIDEVVRAATAGVDIDFTQGIDSFETNEQVDVDLVTAGLPGGSRALVPAAEAQAHLARTLRTTVAGRYDGTFNGDDSGVFHVFVDRAGSLYGWAVDSSGEPIALVGDADTDGGFLAGNASSGATFNGQIERDGTLAGTWQNSSEAGNFSGTRTISVSNNLDQGLVASLAGTYTGVTDTDEGPEAFTVFLDANGNFSLPAPDNQVAGTLISTSGTTAELRALTDEGDEVQGTFDSAGTLNGSFNNTLEGFGGNFTATRE